MRSWLVSNQVVLSSVVVVLAVCVVAMLSVFLVIEKIDDTADSADRKAQRALIRQTLRHEKVCSASLPRQRGACRDLFERLVRNISAQQRLRLACTMLWELHDPALNKARRRAACPVPSPVP